ncbi:MAG: hydroxypyruvate isomerase [Pseudomonadota bacterium]
MPRFAANLSMLFTEVPFLERFGRAARAGFEAVECQFPYIATPEQIRAELDTHQLSMVLHNLPAGDWAGGERGIACHPDRVAEFQTGVGQAIHYAKVLGVRQLNCLAGVVPAGVSADQARQTLVENLRFAAAALHKAGITLLIEPINTFDIPGFFVSTSGHALALMGEVGSNNISLQCDLYHMQRMQGELVSTLQQHLGRIRHLQIADNPGRHEPGTGEINYAFVFAELDRMGYSGWVGCEYEPCSSTEAGLAWIGQLAG